MNIEQILDIVKCNEDRIMAIEDIDTLKAECKVWLNLYLSTNKQKHELECEKFCLQATLKAYKTGISNIKKYAKNIQKQGWGVKPLINEIEKQTPKGM